MHTKYTSALNSEQLSAVTHTKGPAIILAGAGSGKTRVLTYKAMYLLDSATAAPENILMLTFTNKAANEMKQRIEMQIDSKHTPGLITAKTFHSFCALMLRRFGPVQGKTRDFMILDTADQESIAKKVIKDNPSTIRISPGSLLHAISTAKNTMQSPEDLASCANDFYEEKIAALYKKYQHEMMKENALDFDDLLSEMVTLLTQNNHARRELQSRFSYILIDEYQDTNHAQYAIARELTGKNKNITVVGDFSQSIYSWRGADFTNLEKFKADFPEAETYALEENYRSTPPILDVAYKVIQSNTTHPILKLWTSQEKGEDVVVMELSSGEEEGIFIISTIKRFIEEEGIEADAIAILYRTNAQSRIFEEVCLRAGIAYRIFGGVRFYERKEIKDALAMIRLVLNPKNKLAKERIEKLGKKRSSDIFNALQSLPSDKTPGEILQKILEKTPYLQLFDPDDSDDTSRLENLKELVSVAHSFETITEFLDTVALIESGYEKNNDTSGRINLMTIHSAKGLEFDAVFVVGLEDGVLPHSRSIINSHHLEEERRLLYVAITRAKKILYLTYAKRRVVYGRSQFNLPSQFLVDAQLITNEGIEF